MKKFEAATILARANMMHIHEALAVVGFHIAPKEPAITNDLKAMHNLANAIVEDLETGVVVCDNCNHHQSTEYIFCLDDVKQLRELIRNLIPKAEKE